MPTAKDRLTHALTLLSDDECDALTPLFEDVVEGERFWERDVAVFYNQHAKARPIVVKRGVASHQNNAPGPVAKEDLFLPIPVVKSVPHGETVKLPAPEPIRGELGALLRSRRSRRSFTGERISLQALATLLGHAAGVTGATEAYGFSRLPLRPFPSSGGLGSPEIYLCVQRVDGLEPGLYHYAVADHALERMRDDDPSRFIAGRTFGQAWVGEGAVTFIITGLYDRLRWKYGERGYRYMCMDAGFLGQNLYLVGEAMGLGVCALAGFYDDDVDRFLGIDTSEEMVLMLMSVGVPRPDAEQAGR